MVDNLVVANPEISFQNVDQAKVYGVELDLNKKLGFNASQKINDHFSIGVKAKNLLNSLFSQTYSYNGVQFPFY